MLAIDRLSLHVRAAAAPERAERLARRLREAAVAGVEAGRYALAPPGAPAYVFVERLALHCAVSSEWDDAAIGAEVARALAAALERSVALPQTIAFRDRAELLAAFYCALAEGRAWERWWFEAFDGLRPLSASSALRTSVIDEAALGVAALARLTESSLSHVAGLLTAGDAKRLVEWLAERRATAEAPLAPLWKASASLSARNDDHAGVLRALIAAERAAPGSAGGETLRALRAMSVLRAAAARGAIDLFFPVGESPAARLSTALSGLAVETTWLQRLTESEAALIVEEISRAAQHDSSDPRAAGQTQASPTGERLFTPRGGVFVLLKALDWLGWPAQWARAAGPELARALAWAVALRALEPRGAAGLRDATLTQALAVEQPVALLRSRRHEVRALLQKRIDRAAHELLEEFSRRVPGLAGASPDYLRRNALALTATVERRQSGCTVRLGRAPLDILLVLAGAKSGRIALPGGAALELRPDA